MSPLTFEVRIDHGKLTASQPESLPEQGHGVLTLWPERASSGWQISIGAAADGLPVIRCDGGTITSERVSEIEGMFP